MEISGEGYWSFPKSVLRRVMFLEGRLWHLGFEIGQMRREKLRRQAGDKAQGSEGGWSIHTPRKGKVSAGLKQG